MKQKQASKLANKYMEIKSWLLYFAKVQIGC